MTTLTTIYDAYQVDGILDGVIPGNKTKRMNFLQSFFGNRDTSDRDSIRLDLEFDTRNIMGQEVHPEIDAPTTQLPEYGHKAFGWAYTKEGVKTSDPDFQRQIGQALGEGANPMVVLADKFRQKYAIALAARENLFEKCARDILFYGTHDAKSDLFPGVRWDFEKTVASTDTIYKSGWWSKADLTTLVGNGGAGKYAWGSTGGTVAVDPYQDLHNWFNYASRRQTIESILMSPDAYNALVTCLNTTYKDASDLFINVAAMDRLERMVMPRVEEFQAVTYQRPIKIGNRTVPIYTYDGVYTDRKTGDMTSYVPDGYVVLIPSADNQVVRYGRIQHLKANYAAMPIWINQEIDSWSGRMRQELHTAYFMGLLDQNAVFSIKVM